MFSSRTGAIDGQRDDSEQGFRLEVERQRHWTMTCHLQGHLDSTATKAVRQQINMLTVSAFIETQKNETETMYLYGVIAPTFPLHLPSIDFDTLHCMHGI